MPILDSELQWFRAQLLSDTTPVQNGGRFTQQQIVSGVKNNLFPDVSQAERVAGVEHWRKVFIANRSASNLPLIDSKISVESGTPGDSHVLLYPATQTDTQDQVSARPYGYGMLTSTVEAGDTELTVHTEADWSAEPEPPFQAGDLLRIDARATIEDFGSSEYRLIDAVSYSGQQLTITLAEGLDYGYTGNVGVHCASVIEPADIATGYQDTGATGQATFDWAGYLTLDHLGTVYQVWTLEVVNAATKLVNVSGDLLGDLGNFSADVEIAPNNGGNKYFRLGADGWGPTMQNGDTLTFTTLPAAAPIWYRRVVPSSSGSISSDPVSVCIEGESA